MRALNRSRNRIALSVLALAASVVAGATASFADWNLPATALSSPAAEGYDVDLAVDKKGDAVAVWTSSDGNPTIYAAFRPKDGVWSVATEISLGFGGSSEDASVAMDAKGNALAVWESWDGNSYQVHGSLRPKDGTFGPSFQISTPGTDCDAPQVVFDRKGNAIVVWEASKTIQAAVRPKDGTFGTPELLSGAFVTKSTDGNLDLTVDPKGNVHVSWLFDSSGYRVLAVSTRLKGATSFAAPVQVSAGGVDASYSDIVGDKKGNLLVVWDSYDGASESVLSSFKPNKGSFGPPTLLSTAPNAYYPKAQFDSKGNAVVVWETYDGTYNTVEVIERPKDGSFGAVTTISPAAVDSETPDLVIDKKRNVSVLWQQDDGTDEKIVVARRLKDEVAFGTPVVLQAGGDYLESGILGVDGKGNLIAAYKFSDGLTYTQIFSSVFTID